MSRLNFFKKLIERSARSVRRIEAARETLGIEESDVEIEEFGDLITQMLSEFDNSSSNPELEGLTENSGGPVSKLNELLASVYGARAARIGVAGSSGLNVLVHGAIVPLIAPGATVLIDRDAHMSVVGGCAVSGAKVAWLQRPYDPSNDVQRPPTALQIQTALDANPNIRVVAITSPTYDGIDADIEAISMLCHQRRVILVVDAAWGAGHGLLSSLGFPPSPMTLGADVAVVSLHKKGFAPSQVAACLFADQHHAELFDAGGNLGLQTTSPNFVMLAATEHLISSARAGRFDTAWSTALDAANELAGRLREVHSEFRRIEPRDVGATSADPGHFLVHVAGANVTGFAMLDALGQLGHDAEKATRDTLLLLISPRSERSIDERLGELRRALDIAAQSSRPSHLATLVAPAPPAETPLSVREAVFSRSRWVSLDHAVGEIAAGLVSVYPPGSALFAPGERIEQRHLEYLIAVRTAGGRIRGLNPAQNSLRVVSNQENK